MNYLKITQIRPRPQYLQTAGAIVDEWYPEFNREASLRVDQLLVDDKKPTSARWW